MSKKESTKAGAATVGLTAVILAKFALLSKTCRFGDDAVRIAANSGSSAAHFSDDALRSVKASTFGDDGVSVLSSEELVSPSLQSEKVAASLSGSKPKQAPKTPKAEIPDELKILDESLPSSEIDNYFGKKIKIGSIQNQYIDANPTFLGVRTGIVIPDKNSFSRIFPNTKLSMQQSKHFDSLSKQIKQNPNSKLLQSTESAEKELSTVISASAEDDLTILIGHSTGDGNSQALVLADGSEIPILEIHQQAIRQQKHVLVVTCKSPDLGIGFDISYEQGVRVANKISKLVSQGKTKSEIIREIQIDLYFRHYTVEFLSASPIVAVGGGTAVYLYKR